MFKNIIKNTNREDYCEYFCGRLLYESDRCLEARTTVIKKEGDSC